MYKVTLEGLLKKGNLLINIASSSNYTDEICEEALARMRSNVENLRQVGPPSFELTITKELSKMENTQPNRAYLTSPIGQTIPSGENRLEVVKEVK